MNFKLSLILRSYRKASRDAALRRELASFNRSADDKAESAAWRNAMARSQWTESPSLATAQSARRNDIQ